jgi:hypothetical protein
MTTRENLGISGKLARCVFASLLSGLGLAVFALSCFAFPHGHSFRGNQPGMARAYYAAPPNQQQPQHSARAPYSGPQHGSYPGQQQAPARIPDAGVQQMLPHTPYSGPQHAPAPVPYQSPVRPYGGQNLGGQARPTYQGSPNRHQARPPYPGGQQHLGDWLQRHGSMSAFDQQRALQSEPGFNRLSPETQQRLMNDLGRINSMPPAQRQRTLDRIETWERLSPDMRQQVRSSAQAIRSLPPDRQRMVKKAFRDLREYPPEQRQGMLSSPEFASQFTPQERTILHNVLSAEPYEPHPGP